MDVYGVILRCLPEWLLVVLAVSSGAGYVWRGRMYPSVPPPQWVLYVRGIVLLCLVAPFYVVILTDVPLVQARAMSRVMYCVLIGSQLIGHVQVWLVVRRGCE